MLLGEAEILGQVREAYRIALDLGATGPVLNRMFQNALEVGKRVRTETDIGKRPVSVAFAGVKLAERIFGSLRGHSALILGAGATGEQVMEHLRDRGISGLRVANRSRERARELAARTGAEVVDWEALDAVLEWPDMIVSSVSSRSQCSRARCWSAPWPRAQSFAAAGGLVCPATSRPRADLYNVYLSTISITCRIVEQIRSRARTRCPAPKPSSRSRSKSFSIGRPVSKPGRWWTLFARAW
jgi:glutamyl-tRNA reductase